MVIRLKVPDSHSLNALGTKFGALITRVSSLVCGVSLFHRECRSKYSLTWVVPLLAQLETADRLDLEVIGISFHCGSGCYDAIAYVEALEVAREVCVVNRRSCCHLLGHHAHRLLL